jgi:hypothetical protein
VARWIPNERVQAALAAAGVKNRDIKLQTEDDGINLRVPRIGVVAFPRVLAMSDISAIRDDLVSKVTLNLYKHLGGECSLALLATILAFYGLQFVYRIVLYVAFGN